MVRHRTAALCASVSLWALAAPLTGAFAQSAGEQGGGEITVTATREERQRLDVPATVSVIPRQQIEDRQIRDNQELVRYEPGVSVERTTSGVDPWRNLGGFTIRGVGANRVQIRVDGSRVMEQIQDGTRDLVDLPYMKSVEIMRGPGSVLWGADALGGIVSYRTMDPDDLLRGNPRGWAARLHTSFDSFDGGFTKTGMAAVQITPTLQGIFMISNRTSHEPHLSQARHIGGLWACPAIRYLPCDQFDPMNSNAWNGFGKLVWRPTENHEFKLTVERFSRYALVDQLFDRNYTAAATTPGGQRLTNSGDYWRGQSLERQRYALSHLWTTDLGWLDQVRWSVSYSRQNRNTDGDRDQTVFTVGAPNPAWAVGDRINTRSIRNYAERYLEADLQFTSRFVTGPARHTLTYGFQGDYMWGDYFAQDTVVNRTRGTTTVSEGLGFNFTNSTTRRADLYLQDEVSFLGGRLTVTPGIRWANYHISPNPAASYIVFPGSEPRDLQASRLVPQIGAVFRFDEHHSVYVRYAEGFKMPTAQQLYQSQVSATFNLVPNPSLRPESVRSYEAGIRGRYERGWFSFGIFYADYKDFIAGLQPAPGGGPNDYTNLNFSRVKIHGFEAAGEYRLNESFSLRGALSFQFGEQRTSPTAALTPFNAARPLNGVLALRWFKPEWNLDGEVVSTWALPVERVSSASLYKPGAYMVFDAFMNWRPTTNVTLRAGVMNIFDTRYFANLHTTAGTYTTIMPTVPVTVAQTQPIELQVQPGRTFKASLTVDF